MTNLVDQSQRALGSDLNVGPLGYGCWRLVNMPVAEAQARIEHVLAQGMNLIDTADVYGLDWGGTAFGSAEELLGQGAQGCSRFTRADGSGLQGRHYSGCTLRLRVFRTSLQ